MTLDLVIALSGFFIGMGLAILTKEEFKRSRSHFVFSKNLFIVILALTLLAAFILQKQLADLTIIILLSMMALMLRLKVKAWPALEIISVYGIVIISYWLADSVTFQYAITTLAFLYGLLAGTLYYHNFKGSRYR